MAAPIIDWIDHYNGDHSHLGVDPYSLSAKSPEVRQSQQQGGNPLSGLAQALGAYLGSGQTVDTSGGMPGFSGGGLGGSLGTVNDMPANSIPSMQIPGYTDPLAGY